MPRGAVLATTLLVTALPLAAQGPARPTLGELQARVVADSNAPEAHYALAMGYWIEKRWDDADRELWMAVTIDPGYAEAWLAGSQLFFARGIKGWRRVARQVGIQKLEDRYFFALRSGEQAFLLDPLVEFSALAPDGSPLMPHLSTDDEDLDPDYHPWWRARVLHALAEMSQGQYPAARDHLQAIIDDPRVGAADSAPDLVLWYRALASAHTGDFRSAIDDFRRLGTRAVDLQAPRRGPRLMFSGGELEYLRAVAQFRGGFLDEAVESLQYVIDGVPTNYLAHAQMARIQTALGHWDRAIAEQRAALNLKPDDSTLLVDLGRIYMKAGRAPEAVDVFDLAGRINPRDALAPYLLGQVFEKLGRDDEARTAYRQFVAVAPASYATQCAELRSRLGL